MKLRPRDASNTMKPAPVLGHWNPEIHSFNISKNNSQVQELVKRGLKLCHNKFVRISLAPWPIQEYRDRKSSRGRYGQYGVVNVIDVMATTQKVSFCFFCDAHLWCQVWRTLLQYFWRCSWFSVLLFKWNHLWRHYFSHLHNTKT